MRILGPMMALVLMLGIVACGSDDDSDDAADAVTIETATSCTQLMDLFMPIVQDMLDATSDMEMTEFMTMTEPPDFVTDFEASIEEIGAKSDEIGCEDDEMQGLFDERLDDLTADGEVAEYLLQSLNEIQFD